MIVKLAAINRLMSAANRYRRVKLPRKTLYRAVALICVVVVVYLIIWSTVDPPGKKEEYELTSIVNEDAETIVSITYFCSSGSQIWQYLAVGWNVLLLLISTVLAFQTRSVQKDLNESHTLAMMVRFLRSLYAGNFTFQIGDSHILFIPHQDLFAFCICCASCYYHFLTRARQRLNFDASSQHHIQH